MRKNLRITIAALCAGLLCLPAAMAQFGGVREQAEQSQSKVDALNGKIDTLDAQMETEIEEVVTLLSSVRDSAGTSRSGTSRGKPVRRMLIDAKQQAILGLMDNVQEKQRALLALEGQVGKVWATIPNDALLQEIDILEEKIEKRIDQIVAVTASLTRQQDLERTSMVKRPGSGSTRFRKRTTNPEYKLNQRVTSVSEPIRRRVAEEVAADGDRLSREIADLESNMPRIDNEEQKKALDAELADLREQLTRREAQFDAVASDEQPDVKEATLAEAETIQRQAHDKVQRIQQQREEILQLLSQRDLELNRLRGYQTRLQLMGGN